MTRAELAVALASRPALSYFEQGTLDILLERHLNVSSPRLTDVLYGPPPDGWDFPPRFIKEGTRNTSRLARDSEALLSLVRHHPKDRRLELCLLLIDRLTQLKTLRCDIDPDGRIRYAANITGTETQRHAVHKSNTGTGYNLHSTTPSHRHLFLADEGHDMWNVDLAGADGWTIGCECAALGDPTMLNDLRAGLKPAQAVCLIYQHGAEANTWPYDRLLAAAKEIDKNGWLYMACKKGIWGSCLTGRHEVLTRYGWQQIGHVLPGMEIATWDASSEIRWEVPQRIIHNKYSGTLYRFVGSSLDLEVTGDHRMPYVTNGKLKVISAMGLASRKAGKLPLSGVWMEGRDEPLAALVAAIQSDGHYGGKLNSTLLFTLRKRRKVKRLRSLLKAAGIRSKETVYWSKRDHCEETVFYCYNAPRFPKRAGAWMLEWNRPWLGS